jgi:DNA ligase-3
VVPQRIELSEAKHINSTDDLSDLMNRVLREGLEGLVIKDLDGPYEPDKRRWLKIKKVQF